MPAPPPEAPDGGEPSNPPTEDEKTGDASAPPPSCGLEDAWIRTPQGQLVGTEAPNEPWEPGMGGRVFQFAIRSESGPWGQHSGWLYLARYVRGTMGIIGPMYVELETCIKSGSVTSCPYDEPRALLWNGKTGDDLVLATMTQVHNPKYRYGTFHLRQIDPSSGAIVRYGTLSGNSSQPPIVYATHARVEGDDVHVFGTSEMAFPGQIGSGSHFHAVFAGFMKKSCKVADDIVLPSILERSPTAFERQRDE